MTDTLAREYQDLERASSNELLESDSRRVLGRYAEAAYHALQAGRSRARMGLLRYQAREYAEAVEDWLSAADCFLQATSRAQATDVLEALHRAEMDGQVPAERPDLHAALRERDQGLVELNQRVLELWRDFRRNGHEVDVADERTLRFLLQSVRELPGLPLLHFTIFRQASDLGQQHLAAEHLGWAATFDPDNANLVALLGYLHLTRGSPNLALTLGTDFLTHHPSDAGAVRIMLANVLASGLAGQPLDQAQALEVLRPLVDGSAEDVRERIAALALSASFQYELGHDGEFARLVQELDRLESAIPTPELRSTIAEFRGILLQPGTNGTGATPAGPRRLLPAKERQRLFQKAMQVSLRPMPMAA
jgi:tetratricopeptide (TPR) repeat protein